MKLTLTVPDELYDAYRAQTPGQKNQEAVAKTILDRLQAFKEADPSNGERHLLILAPARRELEAIFDRSVDSAVDLIRQIKYLCVFKIDGGVEHTFKAGELAQLKEQAEFHGIPVDDFVRDTFQRAVDEMLMRV